MRAIAVVGFGLILGLALSRLTQGISAPTQVESARATDRAFFEASPILAVRDLGKTLDYYERTLGFSQPWRWDDGTDFGGISRGRAHVMFAHQPDIATHIRGHQVMFFVENADAFYSEHKRRGAKIVCKIEDTPWQIREYTVEDNNGYYLRIGQIMDHDESSGRALGSRRCAGMR